MSAKIFIDTNILIYSNDKISAEKQIKSRSKLKEIFEIGSGVISTQVLHEFYVASINKLKYPPIEVRKQIDELLNFEVIDIDVPLIKEAIDCSILDQINYWDALVVVSAQKGGCGVLLTEDLNHGQTIKGVKIQNIFK